MLTVFAHRNSTFCVNSAGHCFATGHHNRHGQLGVGDNVSRHTFTATQGIPKSDKIMYVTGSTHHTVVLTGKGNCFATGHNGFGRLGVGDNEHRYVFTPIQGIPEGNKVVHVACGENHTMVLTNKGNCFAAGVNECGQLGVGDTVNKHTFTPIIGLTAEDKVVRVACGKTHTLIVTAQGHCFAAGSNGKGQLGVGDTISRQTFTAIQGIPKGDKVVHVACGDHHTMVLTAQGRCFAAGSNDKGQLGRGNTAYKKTFSPIKIRGFTAADKIVQILCRGDHTIILTGAGHCFSAGSNGNGWLGMGDTENKKTFTPIKIRARAASDKIVHIACSNYHTLIVTALGRCFATGDNSHGQLAVGDYAYKKAFIPIQGIPAGDKVVHVTCGNSHTLIVTALGRCFATGDNSYGQLGLDRRNSLNNFTLIQGIINQMKAPSLQTLAMMAAVQQHGFGPELFNGLSDFMLRDAAILYNRVVCKSHRVLRPRLPDQPISPSNLCQCADCLAPMAEPARSCTIL